MLASTSLPLGIGLASGAMAQNAQSAVVVSDPIDFSADRLTVEEHPNRVQADGDVHAKRRGQRLRADTVEWDRDAGIVTADGRVAIDNGDGTTLYAERAVLDEQFANGTVVEPLVAMKDFRRLAGRRGSRRGGVTTLENASYTACHVIDDAGCPKDPFWTVTASRIVHDEAKHRIRYKDPRLNMLGVPVLWLPALSHGDGSDGGATSGLLVPDITYTATKGVEYAQPYYLQTASDRDLLLTPHVYSGALPMLAARYRRLLDNGAFSLSGSVTRASRLSTDVLDPRGDGASGAAFRGALDARLRLQFGPRWSFDASIRAASDRGYLRRYDISGEDRLRSVATLERTAATSYFSLAAFGSQILRFSDSLEDQAFALPMAEYRTRLATRSIPGVLDVGVNAVSLLRDDGQTVARAGSEANWTARRTDRSGRLWTLTTLVAANGYRVADASVVTPLEYRGADGLSGRGVATAALDVRWPMIGALAKGLQTITPRLQIASSVTEATAGIPNEDSRGADLDETALFALNPLPGRDRWLGGTRLTYGVDWRLDRPGWALTATAGQIVFIAKPNVDLQQGAGLSGRTSDVIAGGSLRVRSDWRLAVHARLNDRTGALRRFDLEGSWSTGPVEALVTYTKLERDNPVELGGDFPDHEEVAAGLRLRFARYWTASGGGVVNLQRRGDDPLSFGNGFQPVRRRLGLAYDDECISIGVTWKREYDTTGNSSGDNFKLRFSIRTLGR